jgi:hypothetical protein
MLIPILFPLVPSMVIHTPLKKSLQFYSFFPQLAEKELQKINAFRAPCEKLHCIMSCCRIINNLLLNASMSENHVPGGADDFLPVLIYVTIKARSPW